MLLRSLKMAFRPIVYKNRTELANLNGMPVYMHDMIDAALRGRLNTFLQGDTGYLAKHK